MDTTGTFPPGRDCAIAATSDHGEESISIASGSPQRIDASATIVVTHTFPMPQPRPDPAPTFHMLTVTVLEHGPAGGRGLRFRAGLLPPLP